MPFFVPALHRGLGSDGAMPEEYLKIPKERVAVLIGTKGSTKREVEEKTKTKITIDSSEGDVDISAKEENWQGVMHASEIARAIGRGFSPEHAMLLLNEDYSLEVIGVAEVVGKSEKALAQKRARVIGTGGRTREAIERNTKCKIFVYGKTISIIGPIAEIPKAEKAVEMLLEGATHKKVYDFLEGGKARREEFEL